MGLAAAGVTLGLVRPRLRGLRALGALALAVAAFYVITPYSADGPKGSPYYFGGTLRFLIPALALGLVILVVGIRRFGPARQRFAAFAFGALTLTALYQSRDLIEAHPGGAWIGLAAVLLALGWAWAVRAGAGETRVRLRGARAIAGVGLLAVVAGLVWQVEGRYMGNRYPSSWARGLHGARIAAVGPVAIYPLYGRDLSNHVQYVARHGPHGAVSRIGTCQEWRRTLNEGGYSYLAVGTDVNLLLAAHEQAEQYTGEIAWTAADPGATVLPGASRNSTVFRIRKPLSPHRCDSAAVRRVERELAGGAGVMEALGRREPSAARIRNVRLRSRDGAGAISGWASGDIPVVPGAVDGLVEAISARGPLLAVTGWAADTERGRPAEWVLAFAGSRLITASAPSVFRPDLADLYGLEAGGSGFTVVLLAEAVEREPLRVFGIAGRRGSELALSEASKQALTRP